MSMDLMVKAMKAKVGSSIRKLVLIKLADNANDQGECWPSYQHIADQCEISRISAIRHVSALEEAGFVRCVHREGPKGNTSNLYHLNLTPSITEIPPSITEIPPSITEILPPSITEIPRTSHSYESVKEPNGASDDTPTKKKPLAYSDEFESIWKLYPKRAGSNPKNKAAQAFNARLKEGYTVEQMEAGVKRYARYCDLTDKTNTEFVLQASTFFGPRAEFTTEYPTTQSEGKKNSGFVDPFEGGYAL